MNKKKILSLIMALVMLVGVFSPLTAFADNGNTPAAKVEKKDMVGTITADDLDATKPKSTALTIHKLVADSYNEGVPVDHNGGTLTETQLGKLGTNVKGLPGVKFTIYKIDDAKDFAAIKDAKPATKTAMETYVTQNKAALSKAEGLTNGETQATGDDGSVSVNLPDGNYWVVESDRPSRVTSSLAVPFAITLPLLNQVKVGNDEPGTKYMKNVHVYPKNLEKKPEMDKAFGKLDKNNTEDKKILDKIDSKTYNDMLAQWKEKYGPQVDQYTRDKETIDARVGSSVPYEVKTSLKAGQKYTILSWSDVMTSGLKYNKDVVLTYRANGATTDTAVTITKDDTKTETDFGFDLVIRNTDTIKAINEALAKGDVEFTLKYTATLTNDAVVDLPESNNITFTPSEPKHKNDKDGVKPTNGELKVTKTWDKGEVPAKALVTYILYEGQTPIASVTLKDKAIQSKSLPKDVTVEIEEGTYNVTFKGLDDSKKYKIEEFADGYDPEYTAGNAITNKVNPDRITPTPPYVVTYGKKFVKTDDTDKKTRLAGAEFVVKNGNGADAKYLVAKTDGQLATEQQNVKTKKEALDKAVETYNNLEAAKQDDAARKLVTDAQEAYNAAVKAAGNVYEWLPKSDNKIPKGAITLVSNGQGQFEITGLAEGTYYLEETKAPKGFGKLTEDVKFTVDKDSYTKNGDINYKKDETTKQDAKQVINKNLTIPQTGGIGTVLFTVVGIGLMAGAVMAMKKNREEA